MLSQQRPHTVGTAVVDPQEYEQTQRDKHLERRLTHSIDLKSQEEHKRHGQRHIHLPEHRVSPVVDRILLFQIQFLHKQIDYRENIRINTLKSIIPTRHKATAATK